MQRRIFLKNSSLVLAAIAVFSNKTIAQLIADPAWKITMLTDDIGIFTEKGGTILFYLSKDGIVVVDSQFPDTAPHLIDELKKRNQQPFRLLINTHHHGDHSSGNIAFKGLVQHVLAHENSKANQERVAKEKKNEDQQLYPDQTFGTVWCEKIGGNSDDNGLSIAATKTHVYLAGDFKSDTIRFGDQTLTNAGNNYNFFVAQLKNK